MRAFAFSARAGWDLAQNSLERARARCVAEGVSVLDLTVSNPTHVGLGAQSSSLLRALAMKESLRYEPAALGLSQGREAVRAYVSRSRGLDVVRENIALTASSSESYAFLLKLLCDPGDSVLVPSPSYPLFQYLTRLEGVRAVSYRLNAEDDWRVDLASVERALVSRAKVLFLVSPNNPTGSVLRRDEFRSLVSLGVRHGVALVVDEVFAEYVWRELPDGVRMACAEAKDGLVFSLGGLSKSAGLPQMKLGWIMAGGNQRLVREAMARLEIIADTYLSVGAPIQHAAAVALELAEAFQSQLRVRVDINRQTLRDVLGGGATVTTALPVSAGWYALLRVPRLLSDEQWALTILERDHVLIHPGAFYGFEQDGFLVASLLAEPTVFREAIGRVSARVERDVS